MHQYLCDHVPKIGEIVVIEGNQAHHALNVLHLDHDRIRLIHDGRAWFADAYAQGKTLAARIIEEDPRVNELPYEVTLCMALIRREKMELVLQKACELGVTRIVPFVSSRCVVKRREERSDKQAERWKAILTEAVNQCKRNIVPELTGIVDFGDLPAYMGEHSYLGYENVFGERPMLGEALKRGSITVVVGPEGGFSEEEVHKLERAGFETVSFGSRILRAETAAVYALSVIGDYLERKEL